ncbi:MAG: hypothetical protein A4E65_01246 [Syntrophorhabdus sp. PtaU1.Bin153]|nr:MAG: hypothetical protein A4E65_01246 [Syntrophorhabdus sp. PtaU1.Bin153]
MTEHHHYVRPDMKAFAANLRKPMPFWKKFWLFLRNNTKKIVTFSNCCGHPGEPGC